MLKYGTEEWNEAYLELIRKRKISEPKPYLIFTPEWVHEFEKAIRTDARYKEAAKLWEGSVILIFKPDPLAGLDNEIFIFIDLWHGECRGAKLVPPEIGRKGDFVLVAEYREWKGILKKELNVVKEITRGNVKLAPYDLKKAAKLAASSQAAIRLVELADLVGTRYIDEISPEEQKAFDALLKELKTEFGI